MATINNIFGSGIDFNPTSFGQSIGDFGAAVGELYQATGDKAEAAAYGQAAQLALSNEQLEKESTAIRETATQRQINLSLGATKAQVAGQGFSIGGSAQDILRSSAQQGAVQKQLTQAQGTIEEQGYATQAATYTSEEKVAEAAASAASTQSIFSSIAGAVTAGSSFI